MTRTSIDSIQKGIQSVRTEIIRHSLFAELRHLTALQQFMAHHVAAVWDFMTLLKSLQRDLTCIDLPWLPSSDPVSRRLINQIVVAEESDVDSNGNPISHFELYLAAMREAGCDTQPMENFIQDLERGSAFTTALNVSGLPAAAKTFVGHTWKLATERPLWERAAVFAFGREDLVPDMFGEIVNQLSEEFPNRLQIFQYYLARHIELDQGEHGPLAMRMVELACGNDPIRWEQAQTAVIDALRVRKLLLDGVVEHIRLQTAPGHHNFG
ncbi:DUF3050 domain-containing protein [bacterium]|nr:DUF3050 domain-containing protein [bacterium]